MGHGLKVRTREITVFVPDPLLVGVVFIMKGELRWEVWSPSHLPPWGPVQTSLINHLSFLTEPQNQVNTGP